MYKNLFARQFEEDPGEDSPIPSEEEPYYTEEPEGYVFEGYKIALNQKVMLTKILENE